MAKRYGFISLRVVFAALLLTTAVGKLLDNRGFAAVLETYRLGFPHSWLLPLGLGLSLFELWLGLRIVSARYCRRNGVLLTVMHLGYAALTGVSLYRGLHLHNCGCFGVFWARPLNAGTVIEDGVLTALSLTYLWLERQPVVV